MLIECPECGESVSDKAYSCPHCGYPIQKLEKPVTKPPKHMRLPNGFGRITKLTGKNLRKPYRVMVSQGKDENGRPIGKLLKPNAYFPTYNEAYKALVEYNRSPYDLTQSITMNEVFEKWMSEHEKRIVPKRATDIRRAWSYCSAIHDMNITLVRTRTIKELLSSIDRAESVKTTIRSALSMMFDYAVEYEYVSRNIMKDIKARTEKETSEPSHHIFTDEEFGLITAKRNESPYSLIYIQAYMGLRPNELCTLETGKLNMTDWYIIGGSKTAAGKDRMIPIHTKIRPLIQEEYNKAIANGSRLLLTGREGKGFSYNTYYKDFKTAFPSHKPHDPRKHFITMAKKSGVDEYALKRIVGHAIEDITESVYTERDIAWLHKELAKIP